MDPETELHEFLNMVGKVSGFGPQVQGIILNPLAYDNLIGSFPSRSLGEGSSIRATLQFITCNKEYTITRGK